VEWRTFCAGAKFVPNVKCRLEVVLAYGGWLCEQYSLLGLWVAGEWHSEL